MGGEAGGLKDGEVGPHDHYVQELGCAAAEDSNRGASLEEGQIEPGISGPPCSTSPIDDISVVGAQQPQEKGAGQEVGDGDDDDGEAENGEKGLDEDNGTAERSTGLEEAALSLLHIIKTEEGQLSGTSSFGVAEDSPTSMDQGGQVPLWIKWRGRWQAGVQCSLEDCPTATVKAMPTYGRKMYIVVFFPSTRSFVWTDWQLVCSIGENPEPLAFGSHETGRDSVADSNIAREFMLRKITASMLDISDRLPVQAVVECARRVSFWKDFAKEATKATRYHELGAMLVTLKSMIVPDFLSMTWVCNRFDDWKHQCEVAGKASSMEKLIKEFKNAVLWDEVGKLWDQLEQLNLDSEWKTWKEFSHLNGMDEGPDSSRLQLKGSPVSVTGCQRTYDTVDHEWNDAHGSLEAGAMDFEQESKRLRWEEDSLGGDSSQLTRTRQMVASRSIVSSSSRSLSTGKLQMTPGEAKNQSNIVHCSAFSVKKGRQCNKYASDGSSFCFKHEPGSSADAHKRRKILVPHAEGDDGSAVICSGETIYGRRCTHKAKEGSQYCLKHMLQDAADLNKRTAGESSSSKPFSTMDFETKLAQQNRPNSSPGSSSRKRKLDPLNLGRHNLKDSRSSLQARGLSKMAPRTTSTWKRCIGLCRGSGGQCSHRAKPGYSHCEKHLPVSREEKTSPLKDTSVGITKTLSNSSENGKVLLLRLKSLVDEYTKARLVNDGAESSQQPEVWKKIKERIFIEASKDLKASESLNDFLTAEMENLKKKLDEEDDVEAKKALAPSLTGATNAAGSSIVAVEEKSTEQDTPNVLLLKQVSPPPNGHLPRYKCKLCAQEFVELVVLGQHWRACHKKEAQQYFRGYICHHCSLPFTNKKGLYRHRNAHHPGTSSQNKTPLVALCIICSEQYVSFEHLWEHLVSSHPAQLCAIWPVTDQHATSDHLHPIAVEESTKCPNCEEVFASVAELRRHITSAHSHHVILATPPPLDTSKKTLDIATDYKYKCKICGLPFRLLPDLGRHHQAEHKPVQAMKVKNAKERATRPVLEEMHIVGVPNEKKKLQKLNVRRAPSGHAKEEPTINELYYQVPMRDPILAEMEDFMGPKVAGVPTNKEILAAATVACCKIKLCNILQNKYTIIPDRLAVKAAKLCSEANVRLQFHREAYVCPNGCKEPPVSSVLSKPTLDASFLGACLVPQLTDESKSEPMEINENLLSKGIDLDENHVVFTTFPGSNESQDNKIVLCKDLSFGKEAVPIPCVIDEDAMGPCSCPTCADNQSNDPDVPTPWTNFIYVTERLLDPSLGLDTMSSQLGCSCQGPLCLPATCEHVYFFDNDNNDAQDIYGQAMVGRFPYDCSGCIILEEGYLVYECNSICKCGKTCQNRVLQKGVQVKLEVYKTRHKGWAVRAAQRIARGTFVCEYIGEVLDDCEANRRGERYDKEGCSYLYDIDAHIDTGHRRRTKPFVIDATNYGNVARFINHSCSPNLVNYQVLVESMDCQLAHIGLYATRDIGAGEELAYDYRYKLLPGKGCPCHCGAKDCRGRLY